MDALRLNQVDLKKHEAENQQTEKKCLGIEKQVMGCEPRVNADVFEIVYFTLITITHVGKT